MLFLVIQRSAVSTIWVLVPKILIQGMAEWGVFQVVECVLAVVVEACK